MGKYEQELTCRWSWKNEVGLSLAVSLHSISHCGTDWLHDRNHFFFFKTDGCGSIRCEFYAVCDSDGDEPKCVCPSRASCQRVSQHCCMIVVLCAYMPTVTAVPYLFWKIIKINRAFGEIQIASQKFRILSFMKQQQQTNRAFQIFP